MMVGTWAPRWVGLMADLSAHQKVESWAESWAANLAANSADEKVEKLVDWWVHQSAGLWAGLMA